HADLVSARGRSRERETGEIHTGDQQHQPGNAEQEVERLSKASPQVGSTPGAGFDLEMKRKKMRALRRRLACRQKSFANRRPESVQLRPCRLQPDSRPKPPGSFKPTRIRALQVFLDIGLAVQQGLSRKRHGDFRRSLSADPVEAFSSHANNSE